MVAVQILCDREFSEGTYDVEAEIWPGEQEQNDTEDDIDFRPYIFENTADHARGKQTR